MRSLALLEIEQLGKTYCGRHGTEVRALDGVSMALTAGEFVAVMGPSGCGKTTLLSIAGGLLAPDRGHVRIDGIDPYALRAEDRARLRAMKVGFVFQQFHLIPYLSVRENVAVPTIASGVRDAADRVRKLLERFGLGHRYHHLPSELSTGERQRTAFARALLNRPKLLLADEPTGNLDRDNAELVLSYLREFADDGGGVLLVTHDRHGVGCASRVVELRAGKTNH